MHIQDFFENLNKIFSIMNNLKYLYRVPEKNLEFGNTYIKNIHLL